MMKNALRVFGLAACISLLSACSNSNDSLRPEQPPNIIFFILDDVGIDQMRAFGYGENRDILRLF